LLIFVIGHKETCAVQKDRSGRVFRTIMRLCWINPVLEVQDTGLSRAIGGFEGS
jgi:hypothetical protein